MPNRADQWTQQEDAIIKEFAPAEAARRLQGRSWGACRARRRALGATTPKRWTAEEDAIICANSIARAVELLPGRTQNAVQGRRSAMGFSTQPRWWTPAEDRKIRRHAAKPIRELAKLFKNRTPEAVRVRRKALGCNAYVNSWTGAELVRLRKMWPSCKRADLKGAFPRHSESSILQQAKRMQLKKDKPALPDDLRQQIRRRAEEDKISIKKLSRQLGCGEYFVGPRRKSKGDDFNKIALAVDFFGGRLVIDWQDE
ncbi:MULTISPECIES: hypothetical protein [unclassified Bradyrhizobium]